jgi:hypothetical protein
MLEWCSDEIMCCFFYLSVMHQANIFLPCFLMSATCSLCLLFFLSFFHMLLMFASRDCLLSILIMMHAGSKFETDRS